MTKKQANKFISDNEAVIKEVEKKLNVKFSHYDGKYKFRVEGSYNMLSIDGDVMRLLFIKHKS